MFSQAFLLFNKLEIIKKLNFKNHIAAAAAVFFF